MSSVFRFALLSAIYLSVTAGGPLRAATYVVNTGDDLDDGACNGAHCSFREAINASNSVGGLDEIHFALPGAGPYVITGTNGFPSITDSVTIDGYTQPGSERQKGHPKVVFTGDYWSGLYIGAPSVTVRGLIIQGFNWGLRVHGSDAVIQGNFIGTNAQGTGASGTGNWMGIFMVFADNALVGGPGPGDRNLISGNSTAGVLISDSTGVVVQGNLIGVDISGSAALPNQIGISIVDNSHDCVIGGPSPGEGNLVSGNPDTGIRVTGGTPGTAAHRTVVQGNIIGTDRTGALRAGNGYGVILGNAFSSVVGGPEPGQGNVIAFNAKGIVSSPAAGNSIFGNRIYDNDTPYGEYLGIDLANDGVSPNDHCDVDSLQNFPTLASATSTVSSVTINGLLDSVAGQEHIVEFFASPLCDPLDHGEGKSYLGRATTVTDSTCLGAFSATLAVAVPDGMAVTATATGPDGSTSEFSACVAANGPLGSGEVPDGSTPGTLPLTASWDAGGNLTLSWHPSCHPGDTDYEIYEGTLGAFYDHAPVTCTTAGATTHTFTPGSGHHYYIVVPTNGSVEGSYGMDSVGAHRPQGAGACRSQVLGPACP